MERSPGRHSMEACKNLLALSSLRLIHALYATLLVVTRSVHSVRELLLKRREMTATSAAVPLHVGIVINSSEAEDVRRIAGVVRSCADAGVHYITLCDAQGTLIAHAAALRAALGNDGMGDTCVLMAGEPPSARSAAPWVRVLALATGRDDVVQAARRVCDRVVVGELLPAAVDEVVVEAELCANVGFPEPVSARRPSPAHRLTVARPCAVPDALHANVARPSSCNAAQSCTWADCCRGIAPSHSSSTLAHCAARLPDAYARRWSSTAPCSSGMGGDRDCFAIPDGHRARKQGARQSPWSVPSVSPARHGRCRILSCVEYDAVPNAVGFYFAYSATRGAASRQAAARRHAYLSASPSGALAIAGSREPVRRLAQLLKLGERATARHT